jgi:hypothetical protein
MHVLGGGQAGADVEQLGNARLGGEETDHSGEHVTLGAHAELGFGEGGDDAVAYRPVGGGAGGAAE